MNDPIEDAANAFLDRYHFGSDEVLEDLKTVIRAEIERAGDPLAAYEGKDGHRQWWSGGTWLYPGDRVVIMAAPPP
jgi:hypothetical protein